MKRISSDMLNFIIAVSAILISAASFYATYLQAQSANQQVKAMTYPLLQLQHGNFDLETKTEKLYLTIRNSGVGPAQIKSLNYIYEGEKYSHLNAFLKACCEPEYSELGVKLKSNSLPIEASMITSDATNKILSAGEQLNLMTMLKSTENLSLWNQLNTARFKNFGINACYCSLLDKCYELNQKQQVKEVLSCE